MTEAHSVLIEDELDALVASVPSFSIGDIVVARTTNVPHGQRQVGPVLVIGTNVVDGADILYGLRFTDKAWVEPEDGDIDMPLVDDREGRPRIRLRMNCVFTSPISNDFLPTKIRQVSPAFMKQVTTALSEIDRTRGLRLNQAYNIGPRKAILHDLLPSLFPPVKKPGPSSPHLFDTFLAEAEGLSGRTLQVLKKTQADFEAGHYAEAEGRLHKLAEAQQDCGSPCAPLTRAALGILHEKAATLVDPEYRDAVRAAAVRDYKAVRRMPENVTARLGLLRCGVTPWRAP